MLPMSWPLRLGRRARTCASNSSSRRRGRPPSTSTSASTTGPPPTDEDVAQDDNSSNNNNSYRLHPPLRQRHLKSPTEQKVCCVSPFFVEVGRVVSRCYTPPSQFPMSFLVPFSSPAFCPSSTMDHFHRRPSSSFSFLLAVSAVLLLLLLVLSLLPLHISNIDCSS